MATIFAERGRLGIDFRLPHQGKRIRCREFLRVADSQAGRQLARKRRQTVEAALVTGELNAETYSKYFPASKRPRKLGIAPGREAPTMAEAIAAFLERKRNDRKAEGTIRYYQDLFNPFVLVDSSLADRQIDRVLREDLEDLLDGIAKRTSTNRVNRVRAALFGLFQYCTSRYAVSENPVAHVETRRPQEGEAGEKDPAPDPFAEEEIRAIVAAVRQPAHRALIEVAFDTGMRPGELAALKWDAIDSSNERIEVRASRSRFGEGRTKTRRSRRWIDMRATAKAALSAHRKRVQLRSSYVFSSTKHLGRESITYVPMDMKNWNRRSWPAIVDRAGVRFRAFGQCRHTFAVLKLSDPETDLRYIADQMGHANLEMLFKHYLRWMPGRTKRPKRDVMAEVMAAKSGELAK